jgi:hypothetical protein
VVVALAAAGAAVGGLSAIGAPPVVAAPVVTVSPVNCVDAAVPRASTSLSSVLDSAEADRSVSRLANSGAPDRTGRSSASGTLASRARAAAQDGGSSSGTNADQRVDDSATSGGGGAAARSAGSDTATASADELAQALADAVAGSTNAAGRRLAAALADEGFVPSDGVGASQADATGGASGNAGLGTGSARSSQGSQVGGAQAICTDPQAQLDDSAAQTGGRLDGAGSTGVDDTAQQSVRGQQPVLTDERLGETAGPAQRAGSGADDRAIESIAAVLERVGAAAGRGDGPRG